MSTVNLRFRLLSAVLVPLLLLLASLQPVQAETKSISATLTVTQPLSKAPAPITPVFAIITNFTAYTGPFPFMTGTFYVGATGQYSATLNSPAVSNGFYILKGTFSPSTGTPSTPLSNFIVFSQQLTNTVINNITLEAGKQYSYIFIFSTGNSPVTFTVSGPGCISFGVDACSAKLPEGQVNEPYSAQVPAGAGTPPYTYTLMGGSLPPGIAMSTDGKLSGMPFEAGTFTPNIRAMDKFGQYVDTTYNLTVNPKQRVLTRTYITSVSNNPVISGSTTTVGVNVQVNDTTYGLPPEGSTVTVSDGEATCTATLDATQNGSCVITPWMPGARELTATYNGTGRLESSTSAPYTLNVTAKTPAKIEVLSGSFQHVLSGKRFGEFSVKLLDAAGAAVGGTMVTFSSPTSGPSCTYALAVTKAAARTNAQGVATVKGCLANLLAGRYPITITAEGFDQATPLTFTAQNDPLTNLSLNGTGFGDLFFQSGSQLQVWTMQGAVRTGQQQFALDSGEKLLLTADLDHDGITDYVTQLADSTVRIRGMSNGTLVTKDSNYVGPWKLIGAGDVDGDGQDDLVWRYDDGTGVGNPLNGSVGFWMLKDLVPSSRVIGSEVVDVSNSLIGVQDIDGDGKSDLIWRSAAQILSWWKMNGSTKVSSQDFSGVGTLSSNLDFVGAADFYRDNRSMTLVFRDRTTGSVELRRMEYGVQSGVTNLSAPVGDSLIAIRDTDGDGFPDLVFTTSNGTVVIWQMIGSTVMSTQTIQ